MMASSVVDGQQQLDGGPKWGVFEPVFGGYIWGILAVGKPWPICWPWGCPGGCHLGSILGSLLAVFDPIPIPLPRARAYNDCAQHHVLLKTASNRPPARPRFGPILDPYLGPLNHHVPMLVWVILAYPYNWYMCRCAVLLPLQKGVKKGVILGPLQLDPQSGPRNPRSGPPDPDLDQIWTRFGPLKTPEISSIRGVPHVVAHV
jgi:hypothetical protein